MQGKSMGKKPGNVHLIAETEPKKKRQSIEKKDYWEATGRTTEGSGACGGGLIILRCSSKNPKISGLKMERA